MKKQVLFIQGGGNNGYEIDTPMVDSLKHALDDAFEVTYPQIANRRKRFRFRVAPADRGKDK